MDPPIVVPCVDVLPVVFLLQKSGCQNGGVIFGVLVVHGFMGSIAQRSYTSYSLPAKPSLMATTLFLVFTLYW